MPVMKLGKLPATMRLWIFIMFFHGLSHQKKERSHQNTIIPNYKNRHSEVFYEKAGKYLR